MVSLQRFGKMARKRKSKYTFIYLFIYFIIILPFKFLYKIQKDAPITSFPWSV